MDTLHLAQPLEVLRRSGEGTHLRQMTAAGKEQENHKANHLERGGVVMGAGASGDVNL